MNENKLNIQARNTPRLMAALVLLLCSGLGNFAHAGAVVELIVTDRGVLNPSTGSREGFTEQPGPFFPGQDLLVHVQLTSTESFDIRAMQVDWRGSSPELILGGDVDTVNQSIDGAPNFWFDYSSTDAFGTFPAGGTRELDGAVQGTTGSYLDYSNLFTGNDLDDPWAPSTIFLGTPGVGQIHVEQGVPVRLGAMPVTLPQTEGVYTLDLLAPENLTDVASGLFLEFGFELEPSDPITIWSTATLDERVSGAIRYAAGAGAVEFEVVPEPHSIALLAMVSAGLLRRRVTAA